MDSKSIKKAESLIILLGFKGFFPMEHVSRGTLEPPLSGVFYLVIKIHLLSEVFDFGSASKKLSGFCV